MRSFFIVSFVLAGGLGACGEVSTSSAPGSAPSEAVASDSGAALGTKNDAASGDCPANAHCIPEAGITTANDAGAAVDCSDSTAAGATCSSEGAFCNPGKCASDGCSFCHVLRCVEGKWEDLEAAPLPPSQCADQQCGTSTCTGHTFCVERHSGPISVDGGATAIDYSCEPLPNNCGDCSCATPALDDCPTPACSADPTTGKPRVACFGV
jgi:hypothetical protein